MRDLGRRNRLPHSCTSALLLFCSSGVLLFCLLQLYLLQLYLLRRYLLRLYLLQFYLLHLIGWLGCDVACANVDDFLFQSSLLLIERGGYERAE
jgi:hypothetical protein